MLRPLLIRTEVDTLERAAAALKDAFGLADLLNEPPERLRLLSKLLTWIANAKDAEQAKAKAAEGEAK